MRFLKWFKGSSDEATMQLPPVANPPPMPDIITYHKGEVIIEAEEPLSEPVLSIIRTLDNGEWDNKYISERVAYSYGCYEFEHRTTSLKIRVYIALRSLDSQGKTSFYYYVNESYMTPHEKEVVGDAAMKSKKKFDAAQQAENNAKRKQEFMILVDNKEKQNGNS